MSEELTPKAPSGPRCAALVGPYLSGKTSLLESLLAATGAVHKKGRTIQGDTVGDWSVEARARQSSVEMSIATTRYLGDSWTFLDCPGSVEFAQDAVAALSVADVAIVVCEPVPDRAMTLAPLLHELDHRKIPHLVFINKMDTATANLRAVMEALQAVSERPLLAREIPIREGERISGYVDLVSERAYRFRPGQASDLIAMPETVLAEEQTARGELFEALADFDDTLLEELLDDVQPSREEIYQLLRRDLSAGLIVPVFFGSAENDFGIRRLLKALRHEVPGPEATMARLGFRPPGEALAQVFKTYTLPHTGKLSVARVWRGPITDDMTLNGERISALMSLSGAQQSKQGRAETGEVIGLSRMDKVAGSDILTPSGQLPETYPARPEPLTPVFALALASQKRADEVKLTAALAKLCEDDPSLSFEIHRDTHQLLLWGQGEIHLQTAVERLKNRFNLGLTLGKPQVPYRETIRKGIAQHARHKRQTGGHGQFADIHVDIKPLPRGTGFAFSESVVGGAVPRQYIPSVETGVRESLSCGPLGFPVVDLAVTLTDGSYHSVDSSDAAFKTAAHLAMSEGLPRCEPVLLEPIYTVEISVPTEFTSRIQRLISGRRGQILGFDARPGWKSWDRVAGTVPQAEIHDLIVELRSVTQGVGNFIWRFDHLQEVTGRLADKVVAESKAAAALAS